MFQKFPDKDNIPN